MVQRGYADQGRGMKAEPVDGEFIYRLQRKLPYAKGGQMIEGEFIACTAPSSRNMAECAFLKQAFFRALPKGEGGEASASEAEITGEGIMMLITISPDVELAQVLITARELLSSGVAMVDGEQKLTKPLIDAMGPDDLEGLAGDYLANFILASALRRAKPS